MEKTKRECSHEEWCKNSAKFVVDNRDVCSIHLASACRFSLELSEVIWGDHRTVTLGSVQ